MLPSEKQKRIRRCTKRFKRKKVDTVYHSINQEASQDIMSFDWAVNNARFYVHRWCGVVWYDAVYERSFILPLFVCLFIHFLLFHDGDVM